MQGKAKRSLHALQGRAVLECGSKVSPLTDRLVRYQPCRLTSPTRHGCRRSVRSRRRSPAVRWCVSVCAVRASTARASRTVTRAAARRTACSAAGCATLSLKTRRSSRPHPEAKGSDSFPECATSSSAALKQVTTGSACNVSRRVTRGVAVADASMDVFDAVRLRLTLLVYSPRPAPPHG